MTITLAAWARARGVTKQRAWQWAQAGRIAGAAKVGGRWAVPEDVPAPERMTMGRPRKTIAKSLDSRNESA